MEDKNFKGVAQYKCRMCGVVFDRRSHSEWDSDKICLDVYQLIIGITPVWITSNSIHECADGSCGMADFIGVRKVQL